MIHAILILSQNHLYPLYFMKEDEKPDTLAVIDNYNFYDRRTWRLGPESQVGENTFNKH